MGRGVDLLAQSLETGGQVGLKVVQQVLWHLGWHGEGKTLEPEFGILDACLSNALPPC